VDGADAVSPGHDGDLASRIQALEAEVARIRVELAALRGA
jgi:hypothetical protein